jgi:predicted RNase H-like HicB family nuclease
MILEVFSMLRRYTGLAKRSGKYYVALCLELNVASQGETLEDAKEMLREACEEYLSYMLENELEKEIRPVPLDHLREFLLEESQALIPFEVTVDVP